MVSLVQRILDLHKRLQTVKADHERTTLERQIAAATTEIDHLVYELYDLTSEEIAPRPVIIRSMGMGGSDESVFGVTRATARENSQNPMPVIMARAWHCPACGRRGTVDAARLRGTSRRMGRRSRAAMPRLKADLHTHCADDRYDRVAFSAETLIDTVAEQGYDVLAIACHVRLVHTPALVEYARRRGVLLMPAIELMVEGKHIVVLNPSEAAARASTFAELRAADRRESVVLAPHPYYPDPSCLHGRLVENIDLFDAVEYCATYKRLLNPNWPAVRTARRFGLPMIGSSDIHAMPHCAHTFTWIDAEEASVAGIVRAIRAGRVEVETSPRPLKDIMSMFTFYFSYHVRTLGGLREEAAAWDE
ncbi:MAG TPA: PHP-associated domain-containing protein [Candidatus Hydrogenedentes bacterium]|nr:PHP-associated domain-containing protein [Candidatus Hydrogenedentota bacterium]HRT20702.1 PHP-associated domain-containing protein [Candidatus Hydrogenedentota bacterium]HRT66178.1 PHP-associated domain-containing protein [Candidatus Hydrogenedentota bacterium]